MSEPNLRYKCDTCGHDGQEHADRVWDGALAPCGSCACENFESEAADSGFDPSQHVGHCTPTWCECRDWVTSPKRVTLPSGVEVTIETFAPDEMPPDMQKQWDELKRTGIGPNDPDF